MPKGTKKTSSARKGARNVKSGVKSSAKSRAKSSMKSSVKRSSMQPKRKGAMPAREASRDELSSTSGLSGEPGISGMSSRELRGEMASLGNSDDGEAAEND